MTSLEKVAGRPQAEAQGLEGEKPFERVSYDIISVVNHELRTPLTAIQGALGLLAGGMAGELPEKARSLVDIAVRNSERLVRLINDILDLEIIESGQRGFRFSGFELMPLIERGLESHRTLAESRGIELRVVERMPGALVWTDPDRLEQVMSNLVSNAGRVSLRGGRIEIAVARRNGWLRVSVTDHGDGIPPQLGSRIFEKFAHAGAAYAQQNGGTGLGLSISKAIVERLGGRMGFTSERRAATTFWFELPEWKGGDASAAGHLEPAGWISSNR